MKKIISGNLTKKILIVILIVLLFNFVVPNYSQADWGGVLLDPIVDFFAAIGDAILGALQYYMYDSNISLNGQSVFTVTIPCLIFDPADYDMEPDPNGTVVQESAEYLDESTFWASLGVDIKQFFVGSSNLTKDDLISKSPYGIPIIRYSPEKIFSNQVPALDVNFIDPNDWTDEATSQTQNTQQANAQANAMNSRSIARLLHETVASWYVALRNLAILALLSVLLYVGIRIIISSTASDKAKYKQMLMDWAIALCILFFLHYLMTFILTLTETLTESIGDASTNITVEIIETEESRNTSYKCCGNTFDL